MVLEWFGYKKSKYILCFLFGTCGGSFSRYIRNSHLILEHVRFSQSDWVDIVVAKYNKKKKI